jgi:hypothetical protein
MCYHVITVLIAVMISQVGMPLGWSTSPNPHAIYYPHICGVHGASLPRNAFVQIISLYSAPTVTLVELSSGQEVPLTVSGTDPYTFSSDQPLASQADYLLTSDLGEGFNPAFKKITCAFGTSDIIDTEPPKLTLGADLKVEYVPPNTKKAFPYQTIWGGFVNYFDRYGIYDLAEVTASSPEEKVLPEYYHVYVPVEALTDDSHYMTLQLLRDDKVLDSESFNATSAAVILEVANPDDPYLAQAGDLLQSATYTIKVSDVFGHADALNSVTVAFAKDQSSISLGASVPPVPSDGGAGTGTGDSGGGSGASGAVRGSSGCTLVLL